MAQGRTHAYHIVDPSPWPVVGSLGAFVMLAGAVFWMNKDYAGFFNLPVNGQPWIFLIGLALVLRVNRWNVAAALALAMVLLRVYPADEGRVETVRSFFGVHKIVVTPNGQYHVLMHGTTIHGAERVLNDDGTAPPQYQDQETLEISRRIEREAGTFAVSADDTLVEVESAPGLRQVNASAGTLFAWRFNARPFSVAARLRRIEPVLETASRLTARLEESRLVVSHAVNLSVLKAGIYTAEFSYPTNFNVTDVRGANVEDWKATAGKLKINFTQRVQGTHRLDLVLEQPHKTFPAQITVAPVRLTGATKETAFIGAASAAGIRLKTDTLTNAREIPIAQLSQRAGDEALAFTADAPDWKLSLATERLPARVVAEVFNLVTVGDGIAWAANAPDASYDVVIVDGTLAKDGSKQANARSVVLKATGRKLGAASSEGGNQ